MHYTATPAAMHKLYSQRVIRTLGAWKTANAFSRVKQAESWEINRF